MRVAVVHSFYRANHPSGENIAVVQQIEAMRRGGMDVVELFRYTDEEQKKPMFGLKSLTSVLTGLDWGGAKTALDWGKIDVVNVHNTLPNFGTRWLAHINTPVVTTIHNFRFTCANGLLYRQGRVCTECVARKPWGAIKHGCYQSSRMKTLPVAMGPTWLGAPFATVRLSNVIIAQTERIALTLKQVGIDDKMIVEIPGFVEDLSSDVTVGSAQPRFVFVGRSSPEKGLLELLDIWPKGVSLDVFGTEGFLDGAASTGVKITYRGVVDRDSIRGQLGRYTGLVFPGRAWEGALPLVVREALEAGVPVVALNGSSAGDFITETGAGQVYLDRDGNDLATALNVVFASGTALRQLAKNVYLSRLSEVEWFRSIHGVFEGVVS